MPNTRFSQYTKWLTITQAAKRLNVTRPAVFAYVRDGKLPAARPGSGHMIMIKRADLEAFVAKRDAAKGKK